RPARGSGPARPITGGETMRIRASIAAVVIALAAVVGTVVMGGAQDKTLSIGVLGPLSGGAASYGVELVRGAEMKADEINKAGGLKVGAATYRIKLVSYDHKALAADAATAANKLVFQDKVKYIIGNAVGATCNAVQTVTEPEKVLFSFVCWGTNNLGPDKPHSFRVMLSQWEVAEPFYRWVKEKHPQIKRVAAISPNDTSGKDTNTAVVKALKALGFEVAADEYYERGTKDFYPILTKILAAKPDMLDVAAVDVITKAMQEARSLDTDKVLAALTQKPFETVWGRLVIGGKETYGIDRQFLYPVVISEVRDGKVVDIAQVLPTALKK